MDELKGRRQRRLGRRPATAQEPVQETAESVLPDLPRVGALDALLREVDSLRLSLETDLTLAASAVEAGALDVAGDIIDSERAGLREFELRALGHVAELAKPRKRRLRVPAAPFVAAAAVAGFLIGVVPHLTSTNQPTDLSGSTNTASASFARLSQAAAAGQTQEVLVAAGQLHSQLAIAISQARTDPAAAKAALHLLSLERGVLESSGTDTTLLMNAINASRNLTNAITAALPAVAKPTITPPVVAFPVVTISPQPAPHSSAAPKPHTTTAPTAPKPHSTVPPPTKPTPSTSTASPSPSRSTGLPTAPNLAP